jgi:hypothetical protein
VRTQATNGGTFVNSVTVQSSAGTSAPATASVTYAAG